MNLKDGKGLCNVPPEAENRLALVLPDEEGKRGMYTGFVNDLVLSLDMQSVLDLKSVAGVHLLRRHKVAYPAPFEAVLCAKGALFPDL